MKKWIIALITLCLAFLMNAALAECVPRPIEYQLADIVKSALEREELSYEYDERKQTFALQFDLDSMLGTVNVTVYLYDDMVSVSVDCPLRVKPEHFEKAAIFTMLANNEMYYAQFRVDRDYNWISCRSCNVIESVPPSENEIVTLLYMPVIAMDDYGDGIASICTLGADPYQAFASCQAIIQGLMEQYGIDEYAYE